LAGRSGQQTTSVAIGNEAGNTSQSDRSVAIGNQAGKTNQGSASVAIGNYAGQSNQHTQTIILNSTGNTLNSQQADSFYVKPIRNIDYTAGFKPLYYNYATGEIVMVNDR
jgi:hypothetical protein